ncbi:uncharacterized protein LOC116417721 [Nasonia vitripennis]|uniref:Uncharacterized protein n=1 Tax=Nasonia vitripennis TaxID=7425 RepID=A0A7M7QL61_NASVI|nr:uncharacterized protein LOC116417721 [Nasonia vitripennis]
MQNQDDFTNCITDFANCFPLQRLLLNRKEPPVAATIKELWPCLFTDLFAEIHFQLLTGKPTTEFKENFESYVLRMLIYDHVTLDSATNAFKNWTAVKIIFKYFKEDYSNLFTIVEVDFDMNNMPLTHTYPFIVIIGGLPIEEHDNEDNHDDSTRKYAVVVDGITFPKVNCLVEALRVMLIVYFNINHTYPKECAHFLECIQRFFLEIYPTEGTRSNNQATVRKVLTFIKKIKKIEITEIDS